MCWWCRKPAPLALTPAQVTLIVGEVNRGLNILVDGVSPLAEALGVKIETTTHPISAVHDMLNMQTTVSGVNESLTLHWAATPVPECTLPEDADSLYEEPGSGQVMAAYFQLNRGHCLAFIPPLRSAHREGLWAFSHVSVRLLHRLSGVAHLHRA